MLLTRPPVKRAALVFSLAGLLLCVASNTALAAQAKLDDPKLQAMQQQLDDMRVQLEQLRGVAQTEQRLNAIQLQLETMARELAEMKNAQASTATAIATLKMPPDATAVTTTIPNGRPTFASADARFTASIRSIVMLDAAKFFQSDNPEPAVVGRDLSEGTNFRRARIGFEGRLFDDFDYSIFYEFGGSGGEDPGRLYDAAITYTAFDPLRIKVGAFQPNIGLAAAASTSEIPLMERPSSAEVARNVAAGDSRIAFQVSSNGALGSTTEPSSVRWMASAALTGNIISRIGGNGAATPLPFGEQTAWIGRLALSKSFADGWHAHAGANYQWVVQPNDAGVTTTPRYPAQLRDRPEQRIDSTRLVDTGSIDARHISVLGLEGAISRGPMLIEAEYFQLKLDRRLTTAQQLPDPKFSGWYVQAAWSLTGETRTYVAADARYRAPRPTTNFSPKAGTLGAFELAGRYSVTDLNYREGRLFSAAVPGAVRGGEQKILSLGVNWYLNPVMRLMLNYQNVDVDRLSQAGVQIGQTYDAVTARAQLNF
jgi:phosphate-selective porin OprO/OprP